MFARKRRGKILALAVAWTSLFPTAVKSEILAPSSGEALTSGDSFDIIWTGVGSWFTDISLTLIQDSSSTSTDIASGGNETDWAINEKYTWQVPNVDPGTDYRILFNIANNTPTCQTRLDGTVTCVVKRQLQADQSDAFTIQRKVVILSPSPTPTPTSTTTPTPTQPPSTTTPSPTPSPTPLPAPSPTPSTTTITSPTTSSPSTSTSTSSPSSTTSKESTTTTSSDVTTKSSSSTIKKSTTLDTSTLTSPISSETSLTSAAPPGRTSSPPIGAIVGGVVGGLAVLLVGAWLIVRELRKRNLVPVPPPFKPADPNNQSVWTGDKPYAWDPRVNTTDIYAGRAEEQHYYGGGVQR